MNIIKIMSKGRKAFNPRLDRGSTLYAVPPNFPDIYRDTFTDAFKRDRLSYDYGGARTATSAAVTLFHVYGIIQAQPPEKQGTWKGFMAVMN